MSFYDEPIETLIASIATLPVAGVDHLVALDGRYALYPGDRAVSDANQHAAIVMTCRELGIACTFHAPTEPWAGNEPEKRTALFALGWALADDGDWFLIHDADMFVTEAPDDLREQLERTDRDVATVEVLDTVAKRINVPNMPPVFEFCGLYRAQPILVGPHHAQYRTADGQHLWVGNGEASPVPNLDLSSTVRIEHSPDRRPVERQQAKLNYYAERDQTTVERGDCSRCGDPAVRLVTTGWRWTHIGPVGDWAEACEPCARRLEKVGRRQLLQMGIDPDSVKAENRNGQAPAGMAAR
jgi:hypothetical protein